MLAINHRMVGGRVLMTDSTHLKANANKKKYTKEICVAGLEVATLTNAAAPVPASSSANVVQTGEEHILFDSSHRTYGG